MSGVLRHVFHHLLSWIGVATRPPRRRGRLGVETLEHRETPAVTVTDGAAFALTLDAADNVTVFDNGGFVAWTENGVQKTGTTSTGDVTSIAITAAGAFANTIDLSGVTLVSYSGLTAVTVSAGAGDDTIVGAAFNGSIAGEAGNDTVSFNGGSDAQAFQIGATQSGALSFARTSTTPFQHTIATSETFTLNGSAVNDTLTVQNLNGVASLTKVNFDGGGGIDTVVGPDVSSTWTFLTNVNLGFNSTGQVEISNSENISGGAAPDNFILFNGFGLAGSLNGGGGNDRLDYASYETPVTVNLQTGAATNIAGGIAAIEQLLGGRADDTLIGDGAANLIQGNQGADNISGGDGADAFVWRAGHGSDTIDGGAGADLVDISSDDVGETFQATAAAGALLLDMLAPTTARLTITASETVQIFANGGADTLIVGNLAAAGNLATLLFTGGGVELDTLVAPDLDNTWNITGTGNGNLVSAGGFTGFLRFFAENLTGGAAADVFKMDNGCLVPGRIDGGAGVDTIDYSLFQAPVNVNLPGGSATNIVQGIANLENVVLNSSGNTVVVNDPRTNIVTVVTPNGTVLIVSNAAPVNSVPRRIAVVRGRQILLPLNINDRDAQPGRLRITLTTPRGAFILDRRLLRRIRGLGFAISRSRTLTFTGNLSQLKQALRLVRFLAPARRDIISVVMTTREIDSANRRSDRDVFRIFVR